MRTIKLLATDLDGTLIGRENEFVLYGDFRVIMEKMREDEDFVWAISTGRSLKSFREFYTPMWAMGISPDFVIVDHAYIYSATRFGFISHFIWSLRIRFLLWKNRWNARKAVDSWHQMITRVAGGVTTIRKGADRLWLRFDSNESAAVAARMLTAKTARHEHLQVFKYMQEVDVRFVPYTKGLAIAELATRLGINSENILVVGDGHNDISMMTPDVAHMTGCPSNSVPEVIEMVHSTGGHVAGKASLAGALEVLNAYDSGNVCSDLPEGWVRPSDRENPMRNRKDNHQSENKKGRLRQFMIGALAVYAVLVVFAHFGLIPLAGLILKPYNFVLDNVLKVFSYLGVR